MKKFILFTLVFIQFGCSKIDLTPEYDVVIRNTSDYNIKVKSESTIFTSGNFSEVSIPAKSQVTVKIKSSVGTNPEVITENGLLSSFEEDKIGESYHYDVYVYEFLVEYKVTGTAKTVDLTLANDKNGTDQLSDIPLPWSKGYKSWEKKFVYVAAQNQGEIGTVSSKIFYRGKELFSAESSGAYVIAKASGSLPD